MLEEDRLHALGLSGGDVLATQALVVAPRADASSTVLDDLGLHPVPHPMGPEMGTVYVVEPGGRTAVPGVWATGNVVDAVGTVVKCVADGYSTGAMINADLVMQEATAAVADHSPAQHGSADHAGLVDHDNERLVMDQAYWDARYASADTIWSGRPNPHLVSEIGAIFDRGPGRALDVGAGEGADAIWLAQQGWQVEAIDISPVALARGRARAESLGPDLARRITWTQADLLIHPPEAAAYDLVSMQYMQLRPDDRVRVFGACIEAVAPGGALLVVAHHPHDMETMAVSPSFREMFYTAEQVAESLDDAWIVDVQEARPREATGPDGERLAIRDTVLLARRAMTVDLVRRGHRRSQPGT